MGEFKRYDFLSSVTNRRTESDAYAICKSGSSKVGVESNDGLACSLSIRLTQLTPVLP